MSRQSPVSEVMTTDVLTFGPDDNVAEAMQILVDRGIDGAPVVDAVGAVVGSVVFKVYVSVLPQAEDEGIHVHLPEEMQPFADLPSALRYAEERGSAMALEGARRQRLG